MASGNFKTFLCAVSLFMICTLGFGTQQPTTTSSFLYKQLDYFLQNPTSSGALRLHKLAYSKKNLLHSRDDQLAWVIVHCNLGYYNNQFGAVATAISNYETAWKSYYQHRLSDYDIIENCLQPLGNLYIKIGDLPKAENTIKQYLYLAEQSQDTKKTVSAITNLSIAYNNLGNFKKAVQLLEQGIAIAPNNPHLLINIATNYLGLGDIDTAETTARKVIAIDKNQTNAYQILAAVYLEKKDFAAAKKYIDQAKQQLLDRTKSTTRSLAKVQLAYIDVLLKKSAFAEARKHITEIYTHLLPFYTIDQELPKKEQLIADRVLLQTLDTHAYILRRLDMPLQAIKVFELAFTVNSKLNTLYPMQDTRIIQHGANRNRTERYIAVLVSLYEDTQQKSYLEKAFWAAERSKAPFILQALWSKQVLTKYENDTLVQQKNKLNQELAHYETLILKEKLKGDQANINTIQEWTKEYDSKSILFKELTTTLQGTYPELKETQKEHTLEELQQKLKKNNLTLLEYFYGNEHIYVFNVQANDINFKKLGTTAAMRQKVINYIAYYNSSSAILNDVAQFTKNAYELYQLLEIPEQSHLLIVPDGLLSFVPFETLLTQKTNTLRFQNMPFLLASTQITYDLSASKYIRNTSTKSPKSVLGMFPVFENTDLALPFSLEESTSIQRYFDGAFLEKETATYDRFMEDAVNHDILHLSTHAISGSFSRPPAIRFYDRDMLVNELYGMQLDADLVVLSACETGVGKLAKGEGPLSIGRGFQYAGVENVLFSLWKVNDKTTATLMQDFYKHLGHSKSEALHTAKLEYLAQENISNTQKSPYYWAAFVYYGGVNHSATTNYSWYALLVLVFILIVLLLRQYMRSRT